VEGRAGGRVADRRAPVLFNDYMNTLMGDPTSEKLHPLIDAAAAVGTDCFCIDAGWYDDGDDWWDSVGEWEPSITRFPGCGLRAVLDRIRAAGMTPGLWLEPEVIGQRSVLAFGAGAYVLVVHYANADRNTGHAYNTDVISRFLDIGETGGGTTRGVFRHNYAWDNFWPQATSLTLTAEHGQLVIGNATGWGPDIDRLELARLVLEVENRT
jgi:hypothetical protein